MHLRETEFLEKKEKMEIAENYVVNRFKSIGLTLEKRKKSPKSQTIYYEIKGSKEFENEKKQQTVRISDHELGDNQSLSSSNARIYPDYDFYFIGNENVQIKNPAWKDGENYDKYLWVDKNKDDIESELADCFEVEIEYLKDLKKEIGSK